MDNNEEIDPLNADLVPERTCQASLAGDSGSDAVLLMELQAHAKVWLDISARARGCAEEHQEAGRYDFANWKYEVAGAYELCGKQLQSLLEHPSERQPHPTAHISHAETRLMSNQDASTNEDIRPPALAGDAGSAILIPTSIIPEPLFSCSCDGCSEECTYPANMLYWLASEKRWVCDNCWDQLDPINEEGDGPEKGMTLEDYLRRVNPLAVDLLQNDKAQP